jgi:hypothetical protein
MSFHLHIEQFIVEGSPFAASDSRAFRAALERELAAQSAGMDTSDWSEKRHTSLKAPPISPSAPQSIQSWAAASARSLLATLQPPNSQWKPPV